MPSQLDQLKEDLDELMEQLRTTSDKKTIYILNVSIAYVPTISNAVGCCRYVMTTTPTLLTIKWAAAEEEEE